MAGYSHQIDKRVKYTADDGVVQYAHDYNIDLNARHIYLMGEEMQAWNEAEPGVEFAMANRFIRNLNILMRMSDDPILVHMKTCGGDWHEGMAIYDAIRSCPNRITILNYTHARSMSSLIFSAADKRVMMPHSLFMIHQGSVGFEGTHKQFMTYSEQNALAADVMLDIYVDTLQRSGSMKEWTPARIRKWLVAQMDKKEEVYFTAKEAVELGFADEVFGADGVYDWKKLLM